jgi:hypothetical protein
LQALASKRGSTLHTMLQSTLNRQALASMMTDFFNNQESGSFFFILIEVWLGV